MEIPINYKITHNLKKTLLGFVSTKEGKEGRNIEK